MKDYLPTHLLFIVVSANTTVSGISHHLLLGHKAVGFPTKSITLIHFQDDNMHSILLQFCIHFLDKEHLILNFPMYHLSISLQIVLAGAGMHLNLCSKKLSLDDKIDYIEYIALYLSFPLNTYTFFSQNILFFMKLRHEWTRK